MAIKFIKFGRASPGKGFVLYCSIHWCKKLEDLQNTIYPVISNAYLFHKCLASNSLKMQNNILSNINLEASNKFKTPP